VRGRKLDRDQGCELEFFVEVSVEACMWTRSLVQILPR